MTKYEFKCARCGRTYEFSKPEVDHICCDRAVRRMWSLGGVSFKGSGFYRNDSRKEHQ